MNEGLENEIHKEGVAFLLGCPLGKFGSLLAINLAGPGYLTAGPVATLNTARYRPYGHTAAGRAGPGGRGHGAKRRRFAPGRDL